MKSLLEIEFPFFYNLNRKIVVNEEVYISDFTVTDEKSCTDCKNKTPDSYNQCYDKIVLKVSS